MKEIFKKYGAFLVFCASILLAAALIAAVFLGASMPPGAPLSSSYTQYNDGKETAAVRLGDFDGLAALTYANYTEGEYVVPLKNGLPQGELIDLKKHIPAHGKGTYQFVLSHIDAERDGAQETFAAMKKKYLGYDGNLHLTVYIPTVFAASAVYLDEELIATAGQLSNYDFSDYNQNYLAQTTKHKNGTRGIWLDLSFYGGSLEGVGTQERAGHLITIHFESDGRMLSGMRGTPYIGTSQEVDSLVGVDLKFATAGIIIAAVSFVVFVLLCILKHSLSFLPQIGVLTGVLLTCVSRILLWSSSTTPYFLSAAGMLGLSFIIFAPTFMMRIKIKNFPVWKVLSGVGAANIVLHVAMVFVPPTFFGALHIYRIVSGIVLAAAVLLCAGYLSFKRQYGIPEAALPVLAAATAVISPFIPLYALTSYSQPVIHLFFAILIVTIAVFFKEFARTEQTSRYLTNNLQAEVARRTEDLKSVVEERDRILRYVSHDLRKPIIGIKRFVGELSASETDPVRQKTFGTVQHKIAAVDKNLVELQKYAKLNFSAEHPERIDLAEILASVYDALSPDCEANNVHLHLDADKISAFCRKNTLVVVLNNLIFNALEHADCKNIYLSCARIRKDCIINITDDGKGLSENIDPFLPYKTEGGIPGQNLGLGLYICRELMHDMGGKLHYDRVDGKTVFTVLIPLS